MNSPKLLKFNKLFQKQVIDLNLGGEFMYKDYYNMYSSYYGVDGVDYRNNQVPQVGSGEIITLNQAIELIKTSVGNEKEDELFYDILIKQAPTQNEKEIIKSIRDDERKHNQILRELYYKFTGQMLKSGFYSFTDK